MKSSTPMGWTGLEGIREIAERELAFLRGRKERVERMERGVLLEGYVHNVRGPLVRRAPSDLSMLRLRASAKINDTLKIGGTLVEGDDICTPEEQYWMR